MAEKLSVDPHDLMKEATTYKCEKHDQQRILTYHYHFKRLTLRVHRDSGLRT